VGDGVKCPFLPEINLVGDKISTEEFMYDDIILLSAVSSHKESGSLVYIQLLIFLAFCC
jgi:hypothetical protein